MASSFMTQKTYDVERIRQRFPGLARMHGDQPAVFFDNPGGTQIAQPGEAVLEPSGTVAAKPQFPCACHQRIQ